ncbi:4-coumarate--CoA ligase-like 3 [Phragmites australis]|uniref:4-coumarate--CoA ligase-like 3 n=1 Tax=Phragmites australis TaxID=29695 RepID=UPI002D79C0AA|nr:4-coumarate--CoA ligase-like 3 [Phragmites australis]
MALLEPAYGTRHMELLEPASQHPPADAAAFVLSRLPHPDTVAADDAAFVDAATGGSLSFFALRRTGLSLASGLRRGDAVLILSPNSPLLPQIILGVLAAGGVVAAADPDATAAEIAAAAHVSGAVIVVAAPEVAGKVAGVSVPLLLTLRSLDPRTLSAEELIDGGDLMPLSAPELAAERPRPGPSDVAFVAYSLASTTVALTHADLVAAMASAGLPEEGRVCLASLPTCSLHGLPLLALGLPSAGVTTVLMPPPSDPRASWEAVAAHSATDVVAAPEVTAALAAPMPQDGKLSTLRRVTLAPAPLAPEARQEFHRRLTWVELTELAAMEMESASEQLQVANSVAHTTRRCSDTAQQPAGRSNVSDKRDSLPGDGYNLTVDGRMIVAKQSD